MKMSSITYDSAKISTVSSTSINYTSGLPTVDPNALAYTTVSRATVSSASRVVWVLNTQVNTTYTIQFQVSARIPNGEGLSALYGFSSTDVNGTSERNGVIVYKIGDASDDIGFLIGEQSPGVVTISATTTTPVGTVIVSKIDVVKVSSRPRVIG